MLGLDLLKCSGAERSLTFLTEIKIKNPTPKLIREPCLDRVGRVGASFVGFGITIGVKQLWPKALSNQA